MPMAAVQLPAALNPRRIQGLALARLTSISLSSADAVKPRGDAR